MPPSQPPDPFEKWWPRLRDVGAAFFGAYLLLAQSAKENPSEAFVTVGFALLVVPVASLAQRYLRGKIDSNGNGGNGKNGAQK